MTLFKTLLISALGLLAALASSAVSGSSSATFPEIMGCETGCIVAAAGWPFPFVIDYPGMSVVGSADLIGAMVGEDLFRPLPFLATALFWTVAGAIAAMLLRAGKARPRR